MLYLIRLYGESPDAEKRYSPAVCIGAHKNPIEGNPDPKHISTSFAKRQNLNVRWMIANIALDDALILPHRARIEFSGNDNRC